MLKKIKTGLLCAGVLFSANCLAMTYELIPNQGLNYDIELVPNIPQSLSNPLFWTVKATCTINTEDQSDEIAVKAENKSGSVNGDIIKQGDELMIVVHSGEKLIITANSGAKVTLTNHGEHTVHAKCAV